MDKLKMHSLDGVERNIERIGKLFPNAITEVMRGGKVEHAIDFDVLRQELSDSIVEGREERYQFTWPDKKKAMLAANAPITATLRPVVADSVGRDGTPGGFDSENLYIEGDNLEVLKLLQETYLGRVKMIYIDPPYNTGNDFVYEDDFAQNAADYMENSGQYDEEGNRMVTNTESNGRFHTDWLNMIYPRLRLAKDLLSDDGVIFISIDDNEIDNLKKICSEVFGERNFIANLIWQSTPGSNTGESMKIVTENILLFCKDRNTYRFLNQGISDNEKYLNKDEYYSKRGGYVLNKLDRRMTGQHYSDALNYPIKMPDGLMLYPGSSIEKQEHWNWRWSESKVKWGIENGFIVFKRSSKGVWSVYFKQYEKVNNEDEPIVRTLSYQNLLNIEGANSARGTREVMDILGRKFFDYPKPLSLITHLLKMILQETDIILDFFSGSATTAHAVMQLNAEDGGHRKFIMVQLSEKIDEKSEAYKAGYSNICEIGKERIRRAGEKIVKSCQLSVARETDKHANRLSGGTENTNSDETTQRNRQNADIAYQQSENSQLKTDNFQLDIGFRCLRLDDSNMQQVYYTPDAVAQQDLFSLVDNVKPDRTPEDLLFQVMLDLGVLLSSPIEVKEIASKKVFNVADGFLLACFDQNVTDETVKAIAQMKPYYAVFRDSSMANDSVATNFNQIFETYSPDTVKKVL